MIVTVEENYTLMLGNIEVECTSMVTYDHEKQSFDNPEHWEFISQEAVICEVQGHTDEWAQKHITPELVYEAMAGDHDTICHEFFRHMDIQISGSAS